MGTSSCDASRGLNRTVAEQLSMLPVGLTIDLSLVRRIDADRLEALTIGATLAGESDIAFCLAAVGAGPVMAAIDSQEREPRRGRSAR
jgi:hypothetical protein